MPFFFFSGLVLAIADWIATARENHTIRWITKPGTLLSLLLWFATSVPLPNDRPATWFTLALCFSLVGDIFLKLEGHQLLKGGMAFILAHFAYIAAYTLPLEIPVIFLAIFALNIIPTIVFFRRILIQIRITGDNDLAIGVSVYALVLTAMVSTALSTLFRPGWTPLAAWPTAIGALLFYGSDMLLFTRHFLRADTWIRVITIITYHLGQFALTYGYLWFLYQ